MTQSHQVLRNPCEKNWVEKAKKKFFSRTFFFSVGHQSSVTGLSSFCSSKIIESTRKYILAILRQLPCNERLLYCLHLTKKTNNKR